MAHSREVVPLPPLALVMSRSAGPPSPASPAPTRFVDDVVEYLRRKGDSRGLIMLVERWASVGQPSRSARLHQIRALLDLRLMDRAWVRIREAMEADPDDIEPVILAAEMFVARGWPVRARKILEEPCARFPKSEILRDWMLRARQPAREPPANARDIERDGTPDQQILLAEEFLSTGSFLRARTLLERLKAQLPHNQRVDDLLWGLKGELDPSDLTLEALARKLAPELGTGLIGDEAPEPSESVPLEDVTATRIENPDPDAKEPEFPALFRSFNPHLPVVDDETGEVTSKVKMASPEDLKSLSAVPDEAGELPMRHEDTEIMMVIQGAGVPVPADTPVHTRRPQDYNLKETLDLAAWRKHHGMAGGASDLGPESSKEDGYLEEEDENLVVVTRREAAPGAPATARAPAEPGKGPTAEPAPATVPEAPAARAPMKVIERHPVPEGEPSSPPAPAGSGAGRLQEQKTVVLPDPSRKRRLFVLLGVLGGVIPGALCLAAVAAWFFLLGPDARLLSTVSATLLSDDYDRILAERQSVEKRLATSPDDPLLLSALARLDTCLWSDFTGDLQDLSRARDSVARATGCSAVMCRLAVAELAITELRLDQARAALGHLDADRSDVLLDTALLSAAAQDRPAAQQALRQVMEAEPQAVRPRRVLADLYREAGQMGEAVAVLDSLPAGSLANLQVRVARKRIDLMGRPVEQARAESLAFVGQLEGAPPRLVSAMDRDLAVRLDEKSSADLLGEILRQALARDPRDPSTLLLSASFDLRRQRYLAALDKLAKVVSVRPGDVQAHEAYVQLLVGEDRTAVASAHLAESRASLSGYVRLPVLEAWVTSIGREDLPATRALLDPYLVSWPNDGEALWLLGYAQVMAQQPEALATLEKAHQSLTETASANAQALKARAMATLHLAGAPGRESLEIPILTLAPRDPWVYLILARSYERAGRFRSAQNYLDQAAVVAPRFARVQYERGRYYREVAGDLNVANDAWRAYLELEPDGARADGVKLALGGGAPAGRP